MKEISCAYNYYYKIQKLLQISTKIKTDVHHENEKYS